PAFELALSTAISSAEQGDHYCLAIIDLNNFKQINDRAGHLAGDAALVAFSGKLSETFASSGTSAYRLSGDEFTVIYKGGEVQLHAKLDRINNLFTRRPFMHNGLTIGISCSYGTVALRGNHTQESAIHEADLAMYRSKQQVKRTA
ncbi:MAG: GGDEF domain-containing protein, partial [Fimbriimonadales bacterium]|nr:GGDEF domain-containing protein [Fimbriimonadales bacterium]